MRLARLLNATWTLEPRKEAGISDERFTPETRFQMYRLMVSVSRYLPSPFKFRLDGSSSTIYSRDQSISVDFRQLPRLFQSSGSISVVET